MSKDIKPNFTKAQLLQIEDGLIRRYKKEKRYSDQLAKAMTDEAMKAIKTGHPNAIVNDKAMERICLYSTYDNEDRNKFRATRGMIYRLLHFED